MYVFYAVSLKWYRIEHIHTINDSQMLRNSKLDPCWRSYSVPIINLFVARIVNARFHVQSSKLYSEQSDQFDHKIVISSSTYGTNWRGVNTLSERLLNKMQLGVMLLSNVFDNLIDSNEMRDQVCITVPTGHIPY